jgi:hypothetical protein
MWYVVCGNIPATSTFKFTKEDVEAESVTGELCLP